MRILCLRCGQEYESGDTGGRCPRCAPAAGRVPGAPDGADGADGAAGGRGAADEDGAPAGDGAGEPGAEPGGTGGAEGEPAGPVAALPPDGAPAVPTARWIPPEPAPAAPLPERSGIAWERRAETGFVRGVLGSALELLFEPYRAGRRMRLAGGLLDPLLFGVLGVTLAVFTNLVYAAGGMTLAARNQILASETEATTRFFELTWGTALLGAALAPFAATVWLLVHGLVLHGAARLAGAGRAGYPATFRAQAYGIGAASLLAMLPFCGVPLALCWAVVATGAALAGVHEVSGARAAAAVLLPFVALALGCGGLALLLVTAAGMAAR